MRLPALLLICALLPVPSLAAAPAESVAVQGRRAAEEHWGAYQTQASYCPVGEPTVDTAERHEIALQRRLAELEDAKSAAIKPVVAPLAPCGSAASNAVVTRAQVLTWEWLVRLDLYRRFGLQDGWTKGVASVHLHAIAESDRVRNTVEAALVKDNGQPAIDARKEALRQEVVAVQMLMCPERRPGARDCPTPPASLKGQQGMARIRLSQAEMLAMDLTEVLDRKSRGAVGNPWRLTRNAADSSSRCADGDTIFYPFGPDTRRSVLPGQFTVRLLRWNKLSMPSVATVQDDKPGYSLLISPELGVKIDDPVKRRFVACRLD